MPGRAQRPRGFGACLVQRVERFATSPKLGDVLLGCQGAFEMQKVLLSQLPGLVPSMPQAR